MKKIKFILPLLGLALAGSVLAYVGAHNFTAVNVSTSDGHSYKADFVSQGSFPFDGAGLFDRSKVNLKGILTVTEKDGVVVTESSCLALSGTIKTNGGSVKVTQYADASCSQVYERKNYTVTSYSEDGAGSFTTVAKDGSGVVYMLQGSHSFGP